ncbi:MAG: metallophosphoesterase, partial [Actinobacteria bacterium]|nr:metallophosphoesterase [Actinomycetota bacterium]
WLVPAVVLVVGFGVAACQQPPAAPVVVAVAGDIACKPGSAVTASACQQGATAKLIASDASVDVVQTLGDNQYENGLLGEFQQAYAPSWGGFKAKTHPAVGNHEYQSKSAPNGEGYYAYFGSAAHGPLGYYSYDVSAWHVVVLNTNCTKVACTTGSAQEKWLKSDLAATTQRCIAAVAHSPRYSSGPLGSNTSWTALYGDLLNAHTDLLLSGDDHDYERFAAQDNASHATPSGIVQVVVGTGGKSTTGLSSARLPNSVVGNGRVFGVLELTLSDGSYSGTFRPVAGGSFTDSFSGACH